MAKFFSVKVGQTDSAGFTLLARKGDITFRLTPEKNFLVEDKGQEKVRTPDFVMGWGTYNELSQDDLTPEEILSKFPAGKAMLAQYGIKKAEIAKKLGVKKPAKLASVVPMDRGKWERVSVSQKLKVYPEKIKGGHAVAVEFEGKKYRRIFHHKEEAEEAAGRLKGLDKRQIVAMFGKELKIVDPYLGLD